MSSNLTGQKGGPPRQVTDKHGSSTAALPLAANITVTLRHNGTPGFACNLTVLHHVRAYTGLLQDVVCFVHLLPCKPRALCRQLCFALGCELDWPKRALRLLYVDHGGLGLLPGPVLYAVGVALGTGAGITATGACTALGGVHLLFWRPDEDRGYTRML